ncbi:LacI family DNA-binding transcriptional regulator [Pseudorhizobium tarimense]|nr:LacI family DNA-binding transcriptional regulator [Pseudorhizobium tarimense]MCJ8520717.1 LacI family transcriptional regulator [Pseudorhizobium tarimense]
MIASALDVSVATVSNALSGKGRLSAELTKRIRDKADELGYTPSQAARALRTGRSRVLGLVLPDIANPLFPQIAQAIEYAASTAGYGILIADSRGSVAMQTDAINRLIERDVDGILIVPRLGTRIVDVGRPLAVIDSPSTPNSTVSADHWQGGQLVMEHLVSLGHRHIVLIGNNPSSNVQNDRIGGMRSRLPPGGRAQVLWIEQHEDICGKGAPLQLVERVNAGATAFAAVSDLHALRALTELQNAGIPVPARVSVTGFDDLAWSAMITPALTSVRMDVASIARLAIEALLQAIESDPPGTTGAVTAETSSVPMTLVVRQTTAPPFVPINNQNAPEGEPA